MTLDKQVHSFFVISEAFLRNAGDSWSIDHGPDADETPVAACTRGAVVRECLDALR